MRRSQLIMQGIIVISFLASLYFYPLMPERIASHWNIKGEADGTLPRLAGSFLMPAVSIMLFLLFITIPKIEPLKASMEKFSDYYDAFVIVLILFISYLNLLILLRNTGVRFDMVQFLAPAIAVLFYFVGLLVEKARRNWFIGIRTPWTLSSDSVWDKTNKLAGNLFKVAAFIALLAAFFPDYMILIVAAPAIGIAFYSTVYSYLEYKKENVRKRMGN